MSKKVAHDRTLAEQFSNITIRDLEESYERRVTTDRQQQQGIIISNNSFLHTVEACCRPLQHTAEAATAARGKYFALYDHFGFGTVFITISPTANRNPHVKAFAHGKTIVVPKPWMMTDDDIDLLLEEMIDF